MNLTTKIVLKWLITICWCYLFSNEVFCRNFLDTTLPPRDVFEILKNPSLEQPSLTVLHGVCDHLASELEKYANTLIYIQPTVRHSLERVSVKFQYGLYNVSDGNQMTDIPVLASNDNVLILSSVIGQIEFNISELDQWYPQPVFPMRGWRIMSYNIEIDVFCLLVFWVLAICDIPIPVLRLVFHPLAIILAVWLAAMQVCRIVLTVEFNAEIRMNDFPSTLYLLAMALVGLLCYIWDTVNCYREFWRSDVAVLKKQLAKFRFLTPLESIDPPPPYKIDLLDEKRRIVEEISECGESQPDSAKL